MFEERFKKTKRWQKGNPVALPVCRQSVTNYSDYFRQLSKEELEKVSKYFSEKGFIRPVQKSKKP